MKRFFIFCTFFIAMANTFCQSADHIRGDVLIQLKPSQNIHQIVGRFAYYEGKQTYLQVVEELSPPLRIWQLHFENPTINERAFLQALQLQPEVQVAQFNHTIAFRETIPNDPNFSTQWQWVNTGLSGGTVDADVDADLAWDITTGGTTANGKEIVVCVVEGANRNHPDLQGNLWVNSAEIPGNNMDDDANGYLDDYNGWNTATGNDVIPSQQHGTQVSGMIGAKGNNALFTTGINWNVKIMHVEFNGVVEANVIEAYTYPLLQRRRFNQSGGTEGALVVATNSSWGIDGGNPADSPLWCAFYDSLGVEGILSCGATANNNVNIDQVLDMPTACSSEFMISVTATNNKDVRTFSGYGTTHVDVGAPGENIVTIGTNGGPSSTSGTSFASPLTAGIIALLYSVPCSTIAEQALANPAGTALLIRDALFEGVDIIPNLVNEVKYGGRVNAFNSLNILLQNCGPCPKPYNLQASNIIDVSASISWQSPDSSLHTNFRYRVLGATDWQYLENIASPYALTGLQACTGYEFQLEEICASDSSGFSNSFNFTTDGCCVAPSNPTITNITNTSALFSWEPVFAANSYTVKILDQSGGEETIANLINPSFQLLNLPPCSTFQLQVQTACDTGLTEFTLPVSFSTLGCGACLDLNYCPSAGLSTTYEWIESVNLGFINNISGNNDGYGDFTGSSGITTELLTYTSNPITLTPGYSAGTFPEWFTVYLDFNQDGDFTDLGEKAYDSGATVTSPITGNIVVPGTAVLGTTRMRVVMKWNSAPTGPCVASFAAGEVEDYCVSINPGSAPNCMIPNGLLVTDTSLLYSANIVWDAVPAANGYTLQYRKVGATTWTLVAVGTNILQLSALEACKEYEVHVRSNCTGIESDYSPSIFFKTKCLNATGEVLSDALGLVISPNPFVNDIAVGFHLTKRQIVKIEISDVCGRKVYEKSQPFLSGTHRTKLDPHISSGVYFLKIVLDEGQVSRKIVKF